MLKYGSDKPDLRNPIEMRTSPSISAARASRCSPRSIERRRRVWRDPGAGCGGPRSLLRRMNDWARGEGQPGLGYINWRKDGEPAGPIAKNIGPERRR
jgi:aspartyl-tRNA synthetase